MGFRDKFAITDSVDGGYNSYVYKADACAHRFDDIKRLDADNTKKENWVASGNYGRREYYNEIRLINIAHRLLSLGVPKPTTQNLEIWAEEHSQRLLVKEEAYEVTA